MNKPPRADISPKEQTITLPTNEVVLDGSSECALYTCNNAVLLFYVYIVVAVSVITCKLYCTFGCIHVDLCLSTYSEH